MEKSGDDILEQLIKSLQQATDTLDEYYKRQDFQRFNQAKKLILQIQDRISQVIK